MTRSKVKHEEITEETTRKSTLKKRTESLFKKANELATLCDVDVAVIIQDPKDNEEALWPSREEVEEKVARFMSIPEIEQNKKMTTYESFLVESVKNKHETVKKLGHKNDGREMSHLLKGLTGGNSRVEDLDLRQTECLTTHLNNVTKSLNRKNQEFQYLEQQQQHQQQQQQPEQNQPPSELGSHSMDLATFLLQQQNPPPPLEFGCFPLQQQNQPLLQYGSHSNNYNTIFPLQQQNQTPSEFRAHYDDYTPFPLEQQRDLVYMDPLIPGASAPHRHPAQHQHSQLSSAGTSTDPYQQAVLDPGTMAILSNENAFLETVLGRPNMMDASGKYDVGVRFPPTTDAHREQNDMGFDQTVGADNVGQNDEDAHSSGQFTNK